MDWILVLGVGFLLFGAWFWFQRNRPDSPLLYEDALLELHRALQVIKTELQKGQPSFVQETESNRMMISYLYQDKEIKDQHLFVHNVSLTVPEKAVDILCWNKETQTAIVHFVLNVLQAPATVTVLNTDNAILSIGFVFKTEESHTQFLNSALPSSEHVEAYLTANHTFTIDTLDVNPSVSMEEDSDTKVEVNTETVSQTNHESA